MGGSSSKSSTSTEYKTQNLSAPSAGNIAQAGGNISITTVSKPALLLAAHSVNSAMVVSEKAIDSSNKLTAHSVDSAMVVSEKAIDNSNKLAAYSMATTSAAYNAALKANVNMANNSLGAVTDVVDLNYRRATNQAQNLRDMTTKAIDEVSAASRPGETLNSALLIKTIGVVGGLAVVMYIIKGKK